MLFDRGQRSIEAWYFMFSICFFNASLSMVAIVLASIGCGGDDSRRRLYTFPLLVGRWRIWWRGESIWNLKNGLIYALWRLESATNVLMIMSCCVLLIVWVCMKINGYLNFVCATHQFDLSVWELAVFPKI